VRNCAFSRITKCTILPVSCHDVKLKHQEVKFICRYYDFPNKKGPKVALQAFLEELADSGEVGFGKAPVHQLVQISFDKLGTHIAVIDVVRMFPHVHRQ
jgi:hypothetical protein